MGPRYAQDHFKGPKKSRAPQKTPWNVHQSYPLEAAAGDEIAVYLAATWLEEDAVSSAAAWLEDAVSSAAAWLEDAVPPAGDIAGSPALGRGGAGQHGNNIPGGQDTAPDWPPAEVGKK